LQKVVSIVLRFGLAVSIGKDGPGASNPKCHRDGSMEPRT